MPFTYQDIDGILKKTAGLGRYYTLAGGAALIWHLKHRVTEDVDIYLEPDTWDEEKTPFLIFKSFETIIPTNELLKVISHIKHSGMNVTKIFFEKGTVSIIQNGSMTLFEKERLFPPDRLPVATMNEIFLGKVAAIGGRDKEVDQDDLAHIFAYKDDWNVNYVVNNIGGRKMEYFSFEKAFRKLSEMPEIRGVDKNVILKIRNFGESGLAHISVT